MKERRQGGGLINLCAGALGSYLRFALRTTRWRLDIAEAAASHIAGAPAVAAFWHERLALMPALWMHAVRTRERQGRVPGTMSVLVSRHRDGHLIARVLRQFGVGTVHGSTAKGSVQKGGSAAVRDLARALEDGGQIVVTPDGPKGPARQAAPGVAQIAALAGAVILPCAAQVRPKLVLRTWDRMVLPLPFGRGVLVVLAPITVPREGWEATVPGIAQALTAAAARADAAC